MAAAPELAPGDPNRLLRTSSVLQSIKHGAGSTTYTKFDAGSIEQFKMGAWRSESAEGGTMEWNAATKVLKVRSTSKTLKVGT